MKVVRFQIWCQICCPCSKVPFNSRHYGVVSGASSEYEKAVDYFASHLAGVAHQAELVVLTHTPWLQKASGFRRLVERFELKIDFKCGAFQMWCLSNVVPFKCCAFQMLCLSNVVPFKCQLVCRYNLVDLRRGRPIVYFTHVTFSLNLRLDRGKYVFFIGGERLKTDELRRVIVVGVNKRL